MIIDELKKDQATEEGDTHGNAQTSHPNGLKKVRALIEPVNTLIQRVPEPWRVKIMMPLAIVLLGVFIFKTYELAFSDVNKQKRILQDTWGQTAMVQWFHAGDEVRIYTYSRALDNDFAHLGVMREEGRRVGVQLVFGEQLLGNNDAFAKALLYDVQQGLMGEVGNTRATANLGIYDYHWTELHGKVARSARGMEGFGVINVMVRAILIMILVGALLILRRKITSAHLLGAVLVMGIFMPREYGNGLPMDEPTLIRSIS